MLIMFFLNDYVRLPHSSWWTYVKFLSSSMVMLRCNIFQDHDINGLHSWRLPTTQCSQQTILREKHKNFAVLELNHIENNVKTGLWISRILGNVMDGWCVLWSANSWFEMSTYSILSIVIETRDGDIDRLENYYMICAHYITINNKKPLSPCRPSFGGHFGI